MHLEEAKTKSKSDLEALEKAIAMQSLQTQRDDDLSLSTAELLGADKNSHLDQAYGKLHPVELPELLRPPTQDGPLAQYPTYAVVDEARKWQRIQEWAFLDSVAAAADNDLEAITSAAQTQHLIVVVGEREQYSASQEAAPLASLVNVAVMPDGQDSWAHTRDQPRPPVPAERVQVFKPETELSESSLTRIHATGPEYMRSGTNAITGIGFGSSSGLGILWKDGLTYQAEVLNICLLLYYL